MSHIKRTGPQFFDRGLLFCGQLRNVFSSIRDKHWQGVAEKASFGELPFLLAKVGPDFARPRQGRRPSRHAWIDRQGARSAALPPTTSGRTPTI
jgi:hypothetical protein